MQLSKLNYLFFPSRSRHTKLQGDWSSDVCSSDLAHQLEQLHPVPQVERCRRLVEHEQPGLLRESAREPNPLVLTAGERPQPARSEERRVGKEGRSRWSPYH